MREFDAAPSHTSCQTNSWSVSEPLGWLRIVNRFCVFCERMLRQVAAVVQRRTGLRGLIVIQVVTDLFSLSLLLVVVLPS